VARSPKVGPCSHDVTGMGAWYHVLTSFVGWRQMVAPGEEGGGRVLGGAEEWAGTAMV